MNRKVAFTVLKLGILIAAIAWLSNKADLRAVWRILREANLGWVAVGLGAILTTVFLAAVRWRQLLRALDIHLGLKDLLSIAQIGQFFVVFLPGAAGDDVTRLVYMYRLVPKRANEACGTVVLDRLVGFACLFVLSLVWMPVNWNVLAASPSTRWMAVLFSSVGAGVLCVAALGLASSPARLEAVINSVRRWVPHSKLVQDLASMGATLVWRKKTLLFVAACAMTTQVLVCALFCAVGRAVGLELPLTDWMSFVPVVVASGILPITFSGVGVRDYLLLAFLGGAVHADNERILAVSVLVLAVSLLMAAIGGLVYLAYGGRSHGVRREGSQEKVPSVSEPQGTV